MDTSTDSAPSIVGHTTISNPSWSAILTGAWDNKTGVINNVFTPWTYDEWPTVYNQLETYDSGIETKAIARLGRHRRHRRRRLDPPPTNVATSHRSAGDTNWSLTDDAVTDRGRQSIEGTDPGYEASRTSSSATSSGSTRTGTCSAARPRSTRLPFREPTTISG